MKASNKPTSADFEWASTHFETFILLGAEFNVRAAKKLIAEKPRKVVLLTVVEWKGMAELVEYRELQPEVNLAIPCILAAVSKGHLPIDGWHRIRKALADGVSTIPAVKLTKKETNSIRLD